MKDSENILMIFLKVCMQINTKKLMIIYKDNYNFCKKINPQNHLPAGKMGIRDFSLTSNLWSVGPSWRSIGIKKYLHFGAKIFCSKISNYALANIDILEHRKLSINKN